MKPTHYRSLNLEQLSATLKEVTKNLFQLRCQSATDRLETPSEMRKARREIARIKTIQRERELEQITKDNIAKAQAAREAAAKPAPAAPATPAKTTPTKTAK